MTYEDVLAGVLEVGPLKTWSVIVTILGDLAADEAARLPGPVLTQVMAAMGLKAEALRVAIHRLRRDGWITSERDGRTSLYGLTSHGRRLTREAAGRVYGTRSPDPGDWAIVIAQSVEALQGLDVPGLIPVGPRAALFHGRIDGLPETVLAWRAEPGALPDWAREAVMPEELGQSYAALAARLEQALALPVPEDVLSRTVLRLAALHQWRRLVLRHGEGEEALMGPDWAGAQARARIAALLARLERPGVDALQAAITG
ncbi:hypothetical protein NOI20_03370 [Rhodobacteraceae bacterium 10Alg 79]|uniref:PaaX family transcriptional regulator n=1 Tax=Rhodalgimonas zhirmunskyi TaxID=2964767 RepID=A0AAJ1U889_9RHOB|nr:hypothetical protein [Rhodoalgimonas zhirmunskyi]